MRIGVVGKGPPALFGGWQKKCLSSRRTHRPPDAAAAAEHKITSLAAFLPLSWIPRSVDVARRRRSAASLQISVACLREGLSAVASRQHKCLEAYKARGPDFWNAKPEYRLRGGRAEAWNRHICHRFFPALGNCTFQSWEKAISPFGGFDSRSLREYTGRENLRRFNCWFVV